MTKRSDDPNLILEDHTKVHMIIYRDSDAILSHYYETNRLNMGSDCGFDKLTHTPVFDPTVVNKNINPFGKTVSKRDTTGCPTSQKGMCIQRLTMINIVPL